MIVIVLRGRARDTRFCREERQGAAEDVNGLLQIRNDEFWCNLLLFSCIIFATVAESSIAAPSVVLPSFATTQVY